MSDKGDPWGTPSDAAPEPGDQPPQPGSEPADAPGAAPNPPQQQPPAYGPPQPPPAHGQPPPYGPQPPAYGQQPPAYGQQPPAYGQQPPAYGQQPPAYGGAQPGYGGPQTSGKATAVLVLGIVSLVLLLSCIGFIPAIIALAMAKGAQREIAESGGRLTGESQVKAGKIMSWITIGLTVLGALALVLVLAIGVAVSNSDSRQPAGRVLDSGPASATAFDLRPSAG
jgi:hypothetical protein